jgi:hypothetical protein
MIPADVKLQIPQSALPESTLVYIPQDNKYLSFIPSEYQKYFLDCLPGSSYHRRSRCRLFSVLDQLILVRRSPGKNRQVRLLWVLFFMILDGAAD